MSGAATWEYVYNTDPACIYNGMCVYDLPLESQKAFLGVEGCIWSEEEDENSVDVYWTWLSLLGERLWTQKATMLKHGDEYPPGQVCGATNTPGCCPPAAGSTVSGSAGCASYLNPSINSRMIKHRCRLEQRGFRSVVTPSHPPAAFYCVVISRSTDGGAPPPTQYGGDRAPHQFPRPGGRQQAMYLIHADVHIPMTHNNDAGRNPTTPTSCPSNQSGCSALRGSQPAQARQTCCRTPPLLQGLNVLRPTRCWGDLKQQAYALKTCGRSRLWRCVRVRWSSSVAVGRTSAPPPPHFPLLPHTSLEDCCFQVRHRLAQPVHFGQRRARRRWQRWRGCCDAGRCARRRGHAGLRFPR